MRIAMVDGWDEGRALAAELNRRGAVCFHLRSTVRPPAVPFDTVSYAKDFGHAADFRRTVARLRAMRVQRVVAGASSGAPLAQALSTALLLPTHPRPTRSTAELLAEAGLLMPREARPESPVEAVDRFRAWGLGRVVVKSPTRICRDAEEVWHACRTALASGRTPVLQEALPGREFVVHTVSEGPLHTVVESWERISHAVGGRYPVTDFEMPTDPSAPVTAQVHAYVRAVLRALGVTYGPMRCRVIVTRRGPVLVAAATRIGSATHASVLADLLVGADIPLTSGALAGHGAGAGRSEVRTVSLVNRERGTVAGRGWERRLSALPTAVELTPRVRPGDWLEPTVDASGSPGTVRLRGDRAAVSRDWSALRGWESEGLYTRRTGVPSWSVVA
ncbi:hypothetical protein OG897_05470 [Streptomyces sp. NBC_00237]|uniref:hypothetical protein n=1 Tax=Streptomyces sp. NBC_00237 TaxID=2975687 RepID=UPI00224D08B9|nr:hypothetical protein [Streptomyces sp. NBC_00237]MCX5200912.1 hypothetical protein [Streptomyces sp. NBC_00237]